MLLALVAFSSCGPLEGEEPRSLADTRLLELISNSGVYVVRSTATFAFGLLPVDAPEPELEPVHGRPALAAAWRWSGDDWVMIETKETTLDACDAFGISVLETAETE